MNPFPLNRWLITTLCLLLLPCWWEGPSFGWDLSSSDRSGMYPWDGTPVYEEIAVVKLPSMEFNQGLMGLMADTPLAEAFSVPLELRPIFTASVVGLVMERSGGSGWSPIKGEPNPILLPIYTVLFQQFSGNASSSGTVAGELSAYPLMMPDSAGSAVLELRNSGFETPFLDQDIRYAVMFPFKIGFWVEGDYLHVDILNPEAIAFLLVQNEDENRREYLMDLALQAREGLVQAAWDALSAIFPGDDLLFRRQPLPPYLVPGQTVSAPPLVEIGTVAFDQGAAEAIDGILAATIPNSPFDIRFFQTYAAFDGISGMIEKAIENPADMTTWLPTPDGQVADDVMFLNGITANPTSDLPFIREILTPMFERTFLVPRGSSVISYNTSQGEEIILVDVGSPYFGQILLRMGGHRAPGTPCKLIVYTQNGQTRVAAIDPTFMFQAFFGDTHPEEITQWEGAFNWPFGQDLDSLGLEARELFVAYSGMALSRMESATGNAVELSRAAQEAVQEVFSSGP